MSSWFSPLWRLILGHTDERRPDEDKLLVKACQCGNHQAFATIVQRYQRRVYILAVGMLSDHTVASKVTQQVFLTAWQRLPSFRCSEHFSTWLLRLASRECLQHLKRASWQQALHTPLQAFFRLSKEGDPEEIQASHEPSIQRYLSLLPAKYRLVLILRHLHNMTYEEIAEILALPIGTITYQLFRARNLLKEHVLIQQHEVSR